MMHQTMNEIGYGQANEAAPMQIQTLSIIRLTEKRLAAFHGI